MTNNEDMSAQSVQIIRVFLASPGDLQVERRLARDAIDEINRTVARPAGYQVDLIGWEDTLSSAGRPQEIINKDLLTCQMFIGMLWSRWGTPPDTSGTYTSGFEEEFNLAYSRYEESGAPSITLFFRDVDDSKLLDPGPELTKVLSFKARIISEKKVLFDTFSEPGDFSKKVRLHVADFIHKLQFEKRSTVIDDPSDRQNDSAAELRETAKEEGHHSSPVLEEIEFLKEISDSISIHDTRNLSASDVARLRNLGSAYGSSENDEVSLGAHDANLIYLERRQLDLSLREQSSLVDAGLDAFGHENAPLWSWLAKQQKKYSLWLAHTSCFGPDKRKQAAFRVMTLLDHSISQNDDLFNDEFLESMWFGETIPDNVKNSALEYIGITAQVRFLSFAERELERNNFVTRLNAIKCIIRVKSFLSIKSCAQFALSTSFNNLDIDTNNLVIEGMAELDNHELKIGLEHRSGKIRARALQIFALRGALDKNEIARFFEDSDVKVRTSAVDAYENFFGRLSDDDAEQALVTTKKENSLVSTDFDGKKALNHRKMVQLKSMPLKEVSSLIAAKPLNRHEPYLARADAHFRSVSSQVRADFDDRFSSYWVTHLIDIERAYGDEIAGKAIAELINESKDFHIKKMMRAVMTILVDKADASDLPRLRKAIDEEAVDLQESDAEFFRKRGAWEDILRIDKICQGPQSSSGLGALTHSQSSLKQCSLAALSLAKDRLSELLKLSVSPKLTTGIIREAPLAHFKRLSDVEISSFLSQKDPVLRKTTALKIVRALPISRVKKILKSYTEPEEHRYYNVVLWLDLVESFDAKTCRKICNKELDSGL